MTMNYLLSSFFIIIGLYSVAQAADYPCGVSIIRFESEKAIYKPAERLGIVFNVTYSVSDNHINNANKKLDFQIWIERELEVPFLAVSKKISLNEKQVIQTPVNNKPYITSEKQSRKQQSTLQLKWLYGGKDVFGYRAWLRVYDHHDRLLAEKDTIFSITNEWWRVMSPVSLYSTTSHQVKINNKQVNEFIDYLKSIHVNTVEVLRNTVQEEGIQLLEEQLYSNGRKLILNAEAATEENVGFLSKKNKSIFHVIDWDGIAANAREASDNTNKFFRKNVTNTIIHSPKKSILLELKQEVEKAKVIKNDFVFISSPIDSWIRSILQEDGQSNRDTLYSKIKKDISTIDSTSYLQLVDIWSLNSWPFSGSSEMDLFSRFIKMSEVINNVIEVSNKPLLVRTPLSSMLKSTDFNLTFRPYLATLFASRAKFSGGMFSSGKDLGETESLFVSKQLAQYNGFLSRYSYYLWDPKLEWVDVQENDFEVNGSRPLFWNRLVYQRKLENRKVQTVINLINLPGENELSGQWHQSQVAQNVLLKISKRLEAVRVVFIDADSDRQTPLELIKDYEENGSQFYRIPPITCWGMVVVESYNK